MSESRERIEARTEAYLDGGLSAAERAAIEAGSDPASADVRLQNKIDGRLRVLMSAPAMPRLDGAPAVAESPAVAGRIGGRMGDWSARRWLAAAALLSIAALGTWGAIAQPWKTWFGPGPSPLAASAAYDRLVKAGFEPDWVCTTDEAFAKYSQEKLGVALASKADPRVQLVGWTYITGLLKDEAQVLMAKVDGQPVLVVLGPEAADLKMRVEPGSPLRLHRVRHAGLVMYEITPADAMVVLPTLHGPKCGD